MRHQGPHVIAAQPELALDAYDLAALREAYTKAGYRRRGITFEEAMACKHLRLALQLQAEAIRRARAYAPTH